MIAHRDRGVRGVGRRRATATGAALALASCADGIGRRPPPLPPSPVAAPGTPPAAVRAAQPADVVGTWQMLLLPPDVDQQVNVSPRFREPYQWALISADGRAGIVATPEAPDPWITAQSLHDMFDSEPPRAVWSVVGGVMTVSTADLVGLPSRRDVWHVDVVTAPGATLGLAVQPGDLVMQLRDQAGQPVHRRVMRRI